MAAQPLAVWPIDSRCLARSSRSAVAPAPIAAGTVRTFPTHSKRVVVTSSDDGGYVHDPSAFDEDGTRRESTTDSTAEESTDDEWVDEPIHPEAVDREFDWRGWALVGVIIIAFIVAPTTILLIPPSAEGYRFALLIVPLVPAVLLAVTAVWATTRP